MIRKLSWDMNWLHNTSQYMKHIGNNGSVRILLSTVCITELYYGWKLNRVEFIWRVWLIYIVKCLAMLFCIFVKTNNKKCRYILVWMPRFWNNFQKSLEQMDLNRKTKIGLGVWILVLKMIVIFKKLYSSIIDISYKLFQCRTTIYLVNYSQLFGFPIFWLRVPNASYSGKCRGH